jgi:MFS family permease
MTRSVAPARPVSSIRAAPSWARLAAVVSSHPMVDVYAGFIPPLIGVLQVRCDLTAWQAASLLSLGPLVSGLSQPLFAWLTDHTDSRLFGSAGQPGLEGGQIARLGSIHAGELNALNMLGMGVGGFAAGVLVRRGREKRPIVLVPLLLAPAIALFPLAGRGTGYLLALAAGVGHASVHPLTTSLAQRLLPHRTSLASSLTMGGAWAVAMLAPPAAQWALTAIGLGWTFVLAAALLASSGVVALLLPKKLIRRVASDDLSTGLRQSA